jgi:3-oxoacyl-[acyl-carrier protein] reductase
MAKEQPLAGQVVLVTGASSGIGRATAMLLAARGAKVAVNYKSNWQAADEVVAEIRAAGGSAFAIQTDVTDLAAVQAMVQEVLARWGRIDVLVNNAGGIPQRASFKECTPELWRRTTTLNLDSVYNGIHAVLPLMLERKSGQIINVSSIHARIGGAGGQIHYATSKAAVNALTLGLAREVAGSGVRVNGVAPGLTDTPLQDAQRDRFAERAKLIPMARAGLPEEMAAAVYYLCTAATFTTGETLYCAGGA